MKTKQERIDKVIRELDKLKRDYPETMIYAEVPGKSLGFKIGDANVYEGMGDCLILDAE